jgi:hypothetical protein
MKFADDAMPDVGVRGSGAGKVAEYGITGGYGIASSMITF